MIAPENDEGNIEYKLKLVSVDADRIDKITSQMRFRCDEGKGEAYYYLGVMDDGLVVGMEDTEFTETFDNLSIAAATNNYSILLLATETYNEKKLYKVLIRELNQNHYTDVKICIAGSVDAGKSTMLGVLTSGNNDNGRGSSRIVVFNHDHEVDSGRSSSISQHIVGYDKYGNMNNYSNINSMNKSWSTIVRESVKIISFYDLCGHEKYLRTTIRGLTSVQSDLCIIMVGGNMGINKITIEHCMLCITLDIPFIIVITKIDLCANRKNVLKETIADIKNNINLYSDKKCYMVKNAKVIKIANGFYDNNLIPIFQVSNVTGEGLDGVRKFLKYIQPKVKVKDDTVLYYIDSIFKVNGAGTVIGGQLISGNIFINDTLYLGPIDGEYRKITVKSIYCKKVPTQVACPNSYICLGIGKVCRNTIRRGHAVLAVPGKAYWEFTAEITVVKSHSTTIKVGYTPTVHINSIRQSVRIMDITKKIDARGDKHMSKTLRTNDKAYVRFRFSYSQEYIKKDARILLAEGKVKIIGTIMEVF